MADMSAGQIRAERVRMLGEEFGSAFRALWTEVVQLRWEWKEYLALYGSEKNLEDLNEHAPAFFWLVQHALSGHVISTIANLTDDERTGKYPNLTVRRLPSLASASDTTLSAELDELIRRGSDGPWKPIRDWRNKQLAHLDLDVALERRAIPLAPVQRADVDASIAVLTSVIHAVDKRLHPDTDVRYDVAGRWGEADALLSALRRATESDRRSR